MSIPPEDELPELGIFEPIPTGADTWGGAYSHPDGDPGVGTLSNGVVRASVQSRPNVEMLQKATAEMKPVTEKDIERMVRQGMAGQETGFLEKYAFPEFDLRVKRLLLTAKTPLDLARAQGAAVIMEEFKAYLVKAKNPDNLSKKVK